MRVKLFALLLLPLLLFGFFLLKEVSAQVISKRVIVTFKKDVSTSLQDSIVSQIIASRIKRLPLVNAQVLTVTQAKLEALKASPSVLRVEEDAIAFALCHRWWHTWGSSCNPTPTPTPTPTPGGPTPTPTNAPTPTSTPAPTNTPTPTPTPSSTQTLPWGVDRVDADNVWSVTSADNVRVAIIDTGIDLDHPDLSANIKGGVNTIYSWRTADDDNGHGSHVGGIIAAVNNSIGVVGVGHQIDLYAVKVLNSNGSGYVSDIIEGIQWSINNGIKVINMSLGTTSDIQAFHDAVIAAKNAGITVVAAAGNSGPSDNTVIYPAKYPESIAVSATNSSDGQPSWSSRGPEVDVAGPGASIYSTYKSGGYATLSGTSMATPHVAGAAALVLSTHPGFTPSQVQSHLQANAEVLAGLSSNQQGAGLVDVEKAVSTP